MLDPEEDNTPAASVDDRVLTGQGLASGMVTARPVFMPDTFTGANRKLEGVGTEGQMPAPSLVKPTRLALCNQPSSGVYLNAKIGGQGMKIGTLSTDVVVGPEAVALSKQDELEVPGGWSVDTLLMQLGLDQKGLSMGETQAIQAVAPTAALGKPPTAAIDYSLTFKPFAKELNPIQDKLLNYVLDTGRPAAEIIVKEGPLCITREEFWSLGLLRDLDSHIGNACFKLIHEADQQHGKDIYIEDMFVVPTWKDTQSNITANFPEDVDMKDVLVFPGWTDASGPEHFVLCRSCSEN
ncbi:uncharacterized protein LOC107756730 [Sinocyclocheilus rhinocerous]|uniref:uncharacterized protein LOC107756730 n=1 Tax=Sinocyclocheilus rhinocerous TaxID=307959 RepID=UPI0007BA8069|nr:PREDICTED: uncharacterized protein LOC107756730 [Sinocyclocheilus rhinocerous]